MRTVQMPAAIADLGMPLVASVSGGKDSTACMIALRAAGMPFRAVFADTGWEAPETYAYIDTLRSIFGPIDVVRAESKTGEPRAMVDRIRYRAGFPARMQRWCTTELKVQPLRAYHDAINDGDTVSVVGIRAEESARRAQMAEAEDDTQWGGWIWRPLIDWTEEDVYRAHHEAGVPLNPLYKRGHTRVGCWPCIHANKQEIRLIAEHDPARVDEIAELEAWTENERRRRNAETPGRYKHLRGSLLQASGADGVAPIRDVVAWSRTSRGGRQLPLLVDPPSDGCFRWGLCEVAKRGGE